MRPQEDHRRENERGREEQRGRRPPPPQLGEVPDQEVPQHPAGRVDHPRHAGRSRRLPPRRDRDRCEVLRDERRDPPPAEGRGEGHHGAHQRDPPQARVGHDPPSRRAARGGGRPVRACARCAVHVGDAGTRRRTASAKSAGTTPTTNIQRQEPGPSGPMTNQTSAAAKKPTPKAALHQGDRARPQPVRPGLRHQRRTRAPLGTEGHSRQQPERGERPPAPRERREAGEEGVRADGDEEGPAPTEPVGEDPAADPAEAEAEQGQRDRRARVDRDAVVVLRGQEVRE